MRRALVIDSDRPFQWRLSVCIGLMLLLGCRAAEGRVSPRPTEAEATTLNVFAAASLADAFDEISAAFTAVHPGVSVTANYAGSNQLATQIAAGAPADVYASANRKQMEAAITAGRIALDAPQVFTTNRLVVVVPADNPAGIDQLPDLAEPGALIVLAAAEVPAGQYALEFLDKAAADPAFTAGYRAAVLANVASYEENVRGVLNKVALGEADAGIVYASDAIRAEGITTLEIPDPLNVMAEYPIAPLSDSAHAEPAAAFITYVLSADGQAILARYGFGPVSTP